MKHSGIETEPPAAVLLCGDGIVQVRRFANNLAQHGVERGLIGPDEPARLWSRHIVNCALLVPELPTQGASGSPLRIADVGSGAGLPGLIIAMIRPDSEVTLIEPLERRTIWLKEQVHELGLDNVTVFRGRAEDFTPLHYFDVVTARAVKALKGLIPLIRPLVVSGGSIVLLKGQRIDEEVTEAQKVLSQMGVHDVKTHTVGIGTVDEPTRLFTARVE